MDNIKSTRESSKKYIFNGEGEEKFYWGKKKFTDHYYLVSIIMEER